MGVVGLWVGWFRFEGRRELGAKAWRLLNYDATRPPVLLQLTDDQLGVFDE